jgi:hypothetical protein
MSIPVRGGRRSELVLLPVSQETNSRKEANELRALIEKQKDICLKKAVLGMKDWMKKEEEKLWFTLQGEYREAPDLLHTNIFIEAPLADLVGLGVTVATKAVTNAISTALTKYFNGFTCTFGDEVGCQLYILDQEKPTLAYKYVHFTQYVTLPEGEERVAFDLIAEISIEDDVMFQIRPLRVFLSEGGLGCKTCDAGKTGVSVSVSGDAFWKDDGQGHCLKNAIQIDELLKFVTADGLPYYWNRGTLTALSTPSSPQPLPPWSKNTNGKVGANHVRLKVQVAQVGEVPWWIAAFASWFTKNKDGIETKLESLVKSVRATKASSPAAESVLSK